CVFFLFLHPPRPTLFPYTTLFRSLARFQREGLEGVLLGPEQAWMAFGAAEGGIDRIGGARLPYVGEAGPTHHRRQLGGREDVARSEEHTSELQSRENLVCRLLLEK